MPPRQRARGGRNSATAKAAGKEEVKKDGSAPDGAPPKESHFRRQSIQAVVRLIAIFLITYLVRRFNSNARDFHDRVKPWDVVDLPGRGKGMLANRAIKQGERIITETPLFIVPRQISGSPVELINSKLDDLLPHQQTAFRELSYADSDLDIPEEQIPLSIFQTNGISAGQSGVGIFPRTARMNHACSAGFNAVYTWREKESVLVVHALKEIQKGEELLTAYFDTKQPRDIRRNYLAQTYKFNCSCQICSLPTNESLASDMRLQSMSTSLAKFATWGKHEISGLEALDLVRKIWRTGNEEGYWSERGQLATDAAHVAAAHSDEHAARQWAVLAREWAGYELGDDSEQAEKMRILVDNPQQHAAWASREKMEVGDLNYMS